MKVKIQKICDLLTIGCPALIAITGTLEGSGVIEVLGENGVWLASGLGAVTTAASIIFNFLTGYYKKPQKA